MALITWTPALSVGVSRFDEHHKKLIDLINRLHEAMSAGKGRDVIGPVLDELIAYTKYHFAEEEKLMTMNAYPGLAEHKAAHVALTAKVVELANQQKAGHVAITVPVMAFLKTWLSDHINGTDKKYGPFFNDKGVQ